jgi:hypothetical protein
MDVLKMIREEGWGFKLPGEGSLYWNPRGRVPAGCLEIFITGRGQITWYLVRVSDEVIEEARRIKEARRRALEDLRYEWER